MSDPDGEITREKRGHVLVLGINRPDKLNGFTPKMLRELSEAYTELEKNEELRCALVYAEGKHFTAGMDLPKIRELQLRGEPVFPYGLVDPVDLRDPRRTKPVVFAVKGICFTVGIELMLAADIVIAADNTRFSQLEVKRGIMAAAGATLRFVERGGWGNAMLYLLTGDEFNAEEALRMGFIQKVVPAGQEFDAAFDIARRIADEAAPLAVQATRANSLRFVEYGKVAAVSEINDIRKRLSASEDAKEGVASFVEKRPPLFKGR